MLAVPTLILASRSPRRAQLLREAGYDFQVVASPFDDPPQPDHSDAPHALAITLARQKARALAQARPLRRPRASSSAVSNVDHGPDGQENAPRVILAADTLCVGDDGSILGTPESRDRACDMLRTFVGRTHHVITGVAMIVVRSDSAEEAAAFADDVAVTWGVVNDDQINAYLGSDQWRGKAGGYNLFDRQTAGWPITLSHSRCVRRGADQLPLPDGERVGVRDESVTSGVHQDSHATRRHPSPNRSPEGRGAGKPDPTTVVGLPMRRVAAALRELGIVPKMPCLSCENEVRP